MVSQARSRPDKEVQTSIQIQQGAEENQNPKPGEVQVKQGKDPERTERYPPEGKGQTLGTQGTI